MSMEEELKALDFEIRRLKVQYDLYFQGANPRPPTDQHGALSRAFRKLQGVELRNMTERFMYNSVVNKFNTFQELWTKMMRMKEEGARVHPLAAPVPPSRPPAAPAPRAATRGTPTSAFRIPTEQQDEAPVRRLYESYLAARSKGGDARPPAFETFAREIARQTAALQAKTPCEAVEFKIYSKDNKVSLKIRAVGKPEGS
jgi:hypothetical protein